jgi:curved DNA-binding protein CbpA
MGGGDLTKEQLLNIYDVIRENYEKLSDDEKKAFDQIKICPSVGGAGNIIDSFVGTLLKNAVKPEVLSELNAFENGTNNVNVLRTIGNLANAIKMRLHEIDCTTGRSIRRTRGGVAHKNKIGKTNGKSKQGKPTKTAKPAKTAKAVKNLNPG